MNKKILIINGPNLNLLHKRNHDIYGGISLDNIKNDCDILAKKLELEVHFEQSNNEGDIINFIHDAINKFDGIIINAGAYTHTSIAIRDALEMFNKPKIELHISNIFKREEFRQTSFLSDVVDAIISGLGINGYKISLMAIKDLV